MGRKLESGGGGCGNILSMRRVNIRHSREEVKEGGRDERDLNKRPCLPPFKALNEVGGERGRRKRENEVGRKQRRHSSFPIYSPPDGRQWGRRINAQVCSKRCGGE